MRTRARVPLRLTHRVPLSTGQRHPSLEGSWCGRQVPESHEVVSRDCEREHPVHAVHPSMTKLPQPAHGFEPAEDLFDTLALPLTDQIARVARRALINRTAPPRVILGDVRCDMQPAQLLNAVGGVSPQRIAERPSPATTIHAAQSATPINAGVH